MRVRDRPWPKLRCRNKRPEGEPRQERGQAWWARRTGCREILIYDNFALCGFRLKHLRRCAD